MRPAARAERGQSAPVPGMPDNYATTTTNGALDRIHNLHCSPACLDSSASSACHTTNTNFHAAKSSGQSQTFLFMYGDQMDDAERFASRCWCMNQIMTFTSVKTDFFYDLSFSIYPTLKWRDFRPQFPRDSWPAPRPRVRPTFRTGSWKTKLTKNSIKNS